tara:strand:+ start:268 stop:480 length:213 start_codon:yes stop_codon:yes gene_type:complete
VCSDSGFVESHTSDAIDRISESYVGGLGDEDAGSFVDYRFTRPTGLQSDHWAPASLSFDRSNTEIFCSRE